MGYFKYGLGVLGLIGGVKFLNNFLGLYFLAAMIIIAIPFYIWFRMKRKRRALLIALNKRVDDIYILTPTEEGEPILPANLRPLVIVTEKKKLPAIIQRWYEDLLESKNPHGVEVRVIMYKDGKFVSETPEQYGERVKELIIETRAERHEKLKEKDPGHYMAVHHGVYEWPGKKINGRGKKR